MANNYSNYPMNQQQMPQMPQQMYPTMVNIPSFFPQPIGNVYNLQTASEIGNIPAGNGLSVGLCLAEGVMYVKSLQNGAPALVEYHLSTAEGGRPPEQETGPSEDVKKIYSALDKYDDKISKLENQIKHLKTKLGGDLEWQM